MGESCTFVFNWMTSPVSIVFFLPARLCLLDSRGTRFSAVQCFKESKQASCLSYPAELNTERLNFNKKVLKQIKNQSLSAVVLRVSGVAGVKKHIVNL